MLDHEIADPDRADLALSEEGLEGAVGLQGSVERRRQCLVEDKQVDLVDPSLRPLFSKPCRVSSYP